MWLLVFAFISKSLGTNLISCCSTSALDYNGQKVLKPQFQVCVRVSEDLLHNPPIPKLYVLCDFL